MTAPPWVPGGSAQGPPHGAWVWSGRGAGCVSQQERMSRPLRGRPCLASAQILRGDQAPWEAPGCAPLQSPEGAASAPAARGGEEVRGLPACLGAVPVPLLPLRHLHSLFLCPVSAGAPQTPPTLLHSLCSHSPQGLGVRAPGSHQKYMNYQCN